MSTALGLATLVPAATLLLFVAFVFLHDRPWSDISGDLFAVLLLLWLAALVLAVVLAAVYVVLAARNDRLGATGKAVWIVLVLLALPFAAPAYWWAFLRMPRKGSSLQR